MAFCSYDDGNEYDLPIAVVIQTGERQLDDKCVLPGNVEGFILYLLTTIAVHPSKSLYANIPISWMQQQPSVLFYTRQYTYMLSSAGTVNNAFDRSSSRVLC